MNNEFLKAILWIVGINVLINVLPYPFGLIMFFVLTIGMLYQVYQQTK